MVVYCLQRCFSFRTEAELREIANKDTGRFRKLGMNRKIAPRKMRGEEADNCTERGAYSEGKVKQKLCFVEAEASL